MSCCMRPFLTARSRARSRSSASSLRMAFSLDSDAFTLAFSVALEASVSCTFTVTTDQGSHRDHMAKGAWLPSKAPSQPSHQDHFHGMADGAASATKSTKGFGSIRIKMSMVWAGWAALPTIAPCTRLQAVPQLSAMLKLQSSMIASVSGRKCKLYC